MKRLFFLAAAALMLAAPAAASETGDTLVIDKPSKVKIETRDSVQRIVISGMEGDPYFNYMQRISINDTADVRRKVSNLKDFNKVRVSKCAANSRSTVDVTGHLLLGLATMTDTPADYSPHLWPSFEWSLYFTANWMPFGPKNVWSLGFGIGGINYRQRDVNYWENKTVDGVMQLHDYATDQSDTKSSLSVFRLQVPVLYTHNFDKKGRWSLTLGAIVNINTGAHATRSYTYDGEDYEIRTRGIGQRVVTVDGMLGLKTPCFLPLYVKYSPSTFFRDGRGPKMHQLSFGLYL